MKTANFDSKREALRQASSESTNEEKEPFEISNRILYIAPNVRVKLAFLRWDFDLVPEIEVDGKLKPNPDLEIKFTNNLPKYVGNKTKVEGLRKMIRYTAKESTDYCKVGQNHSFYDKFPDFYNEKSKAERRDLADKAMQDWKDVDKNKWRRSVELLAECFVFEIEKTSESGEKEVIQINKPLLVSFNMIDIYQQGKGGFGKALEGFYYDDNMLETHWFNYTVTQLTAKKELSKKELELVNIYRKDIENVKRSFDPVRPLTYDEFEAMVLSGEYIIKLPDPSQSGKQTASNYNSIQKATAKKVEEKVVFEDQFSNTPPF